MTYPTSARSTQRQCCGFLVLFIVDFVPIRQEILHENRVLPRSGFRFLHVHGGFRF